MVKIFISETSHSSFFLPLPYPSLSSIPNGLCSSCHVYTVQLQSQHDHADSLQVCGKRQFCLFAFEAQVLLKVSISAHVEM